jgi:hypothetical protein
MKITMSEQIAVGNFGDHVDGTQLTAAENFAKLVEEKLTEYCEEKFPAAELDFDLSVENVSGCSRGFDCAVEFDAEDEIDQDEQWEESHEIVDEIKKQYDCICSDLERSSEIYE